MADQKITQLTELSVQPASTDVVPIVDISDTTMAGSGTTKKVSVTNLLASKADAVHTHSLNDLSNVDTTGEANGKIIKHNGTSWAVADDADTAALTPEEVQDIVGAMFTGNTETRVAATYEDSDGTIDLVVDDMTADTQLTDEQVQDVVGAMVSGNTETNIAVTYDDTSGKLNFVSTDTNTQLSTEEVQDIIGAMVSGNTETNIAVTYDDTNGKLDFVSTDTNTQLTAEEVQDIVGAMFSGNTETRIAATYDDSDGTIDLVVDDMSGGGSQTAGDGLDLSGGGEFSVDLKADGGIVIESTEMAVDLGASSITGTLAASDGGTGLTSISTLLNSNVTPTSLGLVIGTNVQAYDATIVVDADIGTSVQAYDADTAKTDVEQTFTAGQRGEVTAVTVSANVATCDLDASNNFDVTMQAAASTEITFSNLDSNSVGQSGVIKLSHAGGATTFNSVFKFAGGTTPTVNTSGVDLIAYHVESATRVSAVFHGNMS